VPGIENMQGVPKILGQILRERASQNGMKKIHVGKQFLDSAPKFA